MQSTGSSRRAEAPHGRQAASGRGASARRGWLRAGGGRACRIVALCLCVVGGVGLQGVTAVMPDGAVIYRDQCASCHGPQGEGVAGRHDEPLFGERTVESLTRLIERTMPEDAPGTCVGDDARAVAAYIHDAFYSPAARARLRPARIELLRLTNRQYRESVADLVGGFDRPAASAAPGGLTGVYFQSKGMNKKDRRVFDRTDPTVAFEFGAGAPGEGIEPDQFSVAWEGSLLAPDTGTYEVRLRTPNGARLYVNTALREGDSNRRDDSDARRQTALIDLWVSSGGQMREETARLFLLGGRCYPLRLDYFKYKETNAAIHLEWKPPHGVWSAIPPRHLGPETSPPVAVVTTPFPPDDSSLGYERGSGLSQEWFEAVTRAALEAAGLVVSRLPALSGAREGAADRVEKLKSFALTFTARAHRRPLAPDEAAAMVATHFREGVEPEQSVKRVVVQALTSPRFLYPGLVAAVDDHQVAARLALAFWDSVPDAALREAAGSGALRTAEQVRGQAVRMAADDRARTKLRAFFHHWLAADEAEDLHKDPEAYPGFDEALIADLRTSLDRFVEHIVWSETSDYRELLEADYLFLNPRMAAFYGVPAPDGEDFARVRFDPSVRAGVITQPFLLAALSYHRSSSPIHRGVFLTRQVLGRMLKPPPMAIEFMDDRFDPTLTMREKVTELTRGENCMGCHVTINPLGFSLEHYDAAGRYRTADNHKPVNAEADYLTASGEVIRLRGPRDLASHAVGSAEARRGFVRQLFQHTVHQAPAAYGPDTLQRLDEAFIGAAHHIRRLWVEVAVLNALHGIENPTQVRR